MSPVLRLPARKNQHLPPPASTRTSTQPGHGMAGMSTGRRQNKIGQLPTGCRLGAGGKAGSGCAAQHQRFLTGKWLRPDPGERRWVAWSHHCAMPRVTLSHPSIGRAITGKRTEELQHPAPLPQDLTPKTSQEGKASPVRCGARPAAEYQAESLGQSRCRVVGAARLRGQGQVDKGAGAVSKYKRAAPLPAE